MSRRKFAFASLRSSPAMRHALDLCRLYVKVDRPVLFVGPTGAGKTTLAREAHRMSGRSGPFVAVGSGETSDNLHADTLFGHKEGAFTGAVGSRPGAYDRAAGGTLLLDDLALMSPTVQGAILRVMETGRYRPLGAKRDHITDCRTFFATTVPPRDLVEQGRLLPDLFSRLGELVIRVPGLKDRRKEILPLAHALAADFLRQELDTPASRLEFMPEVESALLSYDWPTNVRELKAAVERAVLHAWASEEPVTVRLVHFHERFHDLPDEGSGSRTELTPALVKKVVREVGGNQSEAARVLGVHRNTIARYLKSAG